MFFYCFCVIIKKRISFLFMLSEKFWMKYFKTYDLLNSAIPYQELLRDIVDVTGIKPGQYVFDAGSGTGNLSLAIKKKSAKVVSMDFSSQGIRLHQDKDPDSNAILGDLTKSLPFKSNCFDCVVSNNVIYTLDKKLRKKVFLEFYRVLKKGGVIAISNIHKGFKPLAIFKEHIRKSNKQKGGLGTAIDAFKMSISILKMFYYNFLIKREHKSGGINFMEDGEQRKLLSDSGFHLKGQTKKTYAGQAYLDVGTK